MDKAVETQEQRRESTRMWFRELRERLCAVFESLEREQAESALRSPRFQRKRWQRSKQRDGGGGEIALMRGKVFEKVGVNISTVFGVLAPELRREVKHASGDGKFWASGLSVVAHPCSPLVPTAHFNTRYIDSACGWFGGGGDLTPTFSDPWAKRQFHSAFRRVCDEYDPDRYRAFAQACDDYFYLPHRARARGAGGIFFDNLCQDWMRDFDFVKEVGEAFYQCYPAIVRARYHKPWGARERAAQLRVRGFYAEFNLLYDRGTRFGLMTGAHSDAVLMSLPPLAAWR